MLDTRGRTKTQTVANFKATRETCVEKKIKYNKDRK